MSNILIIGDTHIPAINSNYLDFVLETKNNFRCNEVIHIGDVVDFHGISYHEHDPNYHSISDELKKSRRILKNWSSAFPNLKICLGNHDALIYRKAKTHGLSSSFLRSLNDILETPDTWIWKGKFNINGILFMHGKGNNSKFPHYTDMIYNRTNVVIGHFHSVAGIEYSASMNNLKWGMSVGCGIDDTKCTFDYGSTMNRKSILSCGVIIDNQPIIIPMKG